MNKKKQPSELQSDRQQLIQMAGNQIKKMEQQSSNNTSSNNTKRTQSKQQPQDERLKHTGPVAMEDGRLMSEEQYLSLNQQLQESKGQKKKNKLTLGREGSKTQQVAEKLNSNPADSDQEVVSQYLNIPINPDAKKTDEQNPLANRAKNRYSNRVSNGGSKQPAPLTKRSSETYLVSSKPSQAQHKNSSEHRTSLKMKLSESRSNNVPPAQ